MGLRIWLQKYTRSRKTTLGPAFFASHPLKLPPAPISIHKATFSAAWCILLSFLSNESFVNKLNKQPGKEYNYSGCQAGSQKIKNNTNLNTDLGAPSSVPKQGLPACQPWRKVLQRTITRHELPVFLFIEVTHPENKPTCMAREKNHTCFVEKSTKACILNSE